MPSPYGLDVEQLTELLEELTGADGVTIQHEGMGWVAWPYSEEDGMQVALVSQPVEVRESPEAALRAAVRLAGG